MAARSRRRSSWSRRTRSKRFCPIQTCPNSSPTRPIRTASTTSPGVSPTRAQAARSTAIRTCGRPPSFSARRSAMPRTPPMTVCAWAARRLSSSRSGPKIRTEMSAGVPPSPSSIRIPSGVVKRSGHAGNLRRPSPASPPRARRATACAPPSGRRGRRTRCAASDLRCARRGPVRRTTSSTSGNVRRRSSARWFAASTCASDASGGSIVWIRNAPSSRRGMKSRPRKKASTSAGTVSGDRDELDEAGAPHASVEQRRIDGLQAADDRHVLGLPGRLSAAARGRRRSAPG